MSPKIVTHFLHVILYSTCLDLPIYSLDFAQATEYFKDLQTKDPYMLDNVDTYSNILYIQVNTQNYVGLKDSKASLKNAYIYQKLSAK